MGIYIPGVEMPKKGGLIYSILIYSDGRVLGHNGNVIGQAVELPPHGRLGDLDALERNLRELGVVIRYVLPTPSSRQVNESRL